MPWCRWLRKAERRDRDLNTGYVPVVILAVLAGAFASLSLVASSVLRPKRYLPAKVAPYESGIEPVRLPKSERFPVKFYVVAMLFIIFDVETIFLFPWAVMYHRLRVFGLVEMVIFLAILIVGYVYAWRRGALSWA